MPFSYSAIRDLIDLYIREDSSYDRVKDRDLLLYGNRLRFILLENFHDSFALCKTSLGVGIQIRSELSKALQFTVLRIDQLQCTGNFLLPPTRDTEIPGLTAGMMPEWKSSVSRKIWPSVIEMTLVGI